MSKKIKYMVTTMSEVLSFVPGLNTDIEEGFGFWTTYQYDMFKFLKGNRALIQSNLTNIKKSIAKNGWMAESIILVNEFMEIIDGQHRFVICKELGLPIRFQMKVGATIEDARALNSAARQWQNATFIESFADISNECPEYKSYEELRKLYNKYEHFINYAALISIGKGEITASGSYPVEAKDGLYRLSDTELKTLEEKGDFCFSLKDYIAKGKTIGFTFALIQSIAWLYGCPECDNKILERIIKNDLSKITVTSKRNQILDALSEKYAAYARDKDGNRPQISFNSVYYNWLRGNRKEKKAIA